MLLAAFVAGGGLLSFDLCLSAFHSRLDLYCFLLLLPSVGITHSWSLVFVVPFYEVCQWSAFGLRFVSLSFSCSLAFFLFCVVLSFCSCVLLLSSLCFLVVVFCSLLSLPVCTPLVFLPGHRSRLAWVGKNWEAQLVYLGALHLESNLCVCDCDCKKEEDVKQKSMFGVCFMF